MKKKSIKVESNDKLHELAMLDAFYRFKCPYRVIQRQTPTKPRTHTTEFLRKRCDFHVPDKVQKEPTDWDQRIEKLEKYFTGIKLSINTIELNPWTKVNDIAGFIEGHMTEVKTCNQSSVHLLSLERLEKLMEILKANL